MWPWIISLFAFSLADVCYNDIFLHRINAYLPSSGPFCLTRTQEATYKYPVLDEDQIKKLMQRKNEKPVNPIVHHFTGEFIVPVQLPAALLGEVCSSFQFIEIGRNITTGCKLITDHNNCAGFSAENFFGGLVSFHGNETYELPVELANGTDLIPSEWRNGLCYNVVEEAHLRFFMNKTFLVAASLRLRYSPPVLGFLDQKYTITFVNSLEGLEDIEETDDRIYGIQGNIRGPLQLPSLGSCDGTNRTPILFKRSLSTGCTLRVSSCEDSQSKMRTFLNTFLPTYIMANSSADPIQVTKLDGSQPSSSLCSIPIVFHLEIFYSKFGLTSQYREEPVGLYITQQIAGLEINEDINLPIIFNIRFTDVTQEPTSFFSGLPYIDLRLPADAFYPFVRSSSLSVTVNIVMFFFLLVTTE